MAAEALILVAIGVLLTAYQASVRRQRVGLRTGAEVARRLARVDALTGLGNRRAFDEALDGRDRAGRARGHARSAIGLVDLDDLKRINDRFGHLEGDRCLREVARAMERVRARRPTAASAGAATSSWWCCPAPTATPPTTVLGRMAERGGRASARPRDGRADDAHLRRRPRSSRA